MNIFLHEWKRGWKNLLIWTAALGFTVFLVTAIYPEVKSMMVGMEEWTSSMGGFGKAFGMEALNLTDPIAYYGLEVGNTLGIGGAMFAGLLGAGMLAKEEGAHTSEFLLTLPLRRVSVALWKLAAVVSMIVVFNVLCAALGLAGFVLAGESLDLGVVLLYHLSLLLMMLQIGIFCFGISGFLRSVSLGVGIGVALIFYVMNIFSNLLEEYEVLRFFTPFGFSEASRVIPEETIEVPQVLVTMALAVVVCVAGSAYYSKKDMVI